MEEMFSIKYDTKANGDSDTLDSLVNLLFFGNRNISLIYQSIVAISPKRTMTKDLVARKYSMLDEFPKQYVNIFQ